MEIPRAATTMKQNSAHRKEEAGVVMSMTEVVGFTWSTSLRPTRVSYCADAMSGYGKQKYRCWEKD